MTYLTSDTSPELVRAAWCEALESGEFEQGRTCLAEVDDDSNPTEFCCLGVLTKLAHDAGVPDDDPASWDRAFPPRTIADWAGLSDPQGSYADYDPDDAHDYNYSLAESNDNGASFKDIARTIRAEPTGLVS